jgi:dTDP-4-dehydrorhamnose 3,5-epimerase
MKVEQTPLPGVLLISPDVHKDARGYFIETYHEERYRAAGIDATFVQDNLSASSKGVLRGMHAQLRRPQAKLVRCAEGSVWDVVADVRVGSPSFGRWFGAELDAESGLSVYVPEGFAHGFQTLEDDTEVLYQISVPYHAADADGLRWDDPALAISWPAVEERVISARDLAFPLLQAAPALC